MPFIFERMRILTLGTEEHLQNIQPYLQGHGCILDAMRNMEDVSSYLVTNEYDCIVAVTSFPEALTLVETVTNMGRKEGLIILTDSSSPERVSLLNAGADDILDPTISCQELLARLKAIVRRKKFNAIQKLYFGNLLIDIQSKSVHVWDTILSLTKMEYEILLYLIANKNRVVSKEKIAEYFWEDETYDASSYNFLAAHLKNLRKKLKESRAEVEIKNIYKVGYQIQEM